jgi:superfamily I DNA/RNA helicase
MSKGLEFDEVIIPAVNNETYSSEYDRSLLYIACTRAMHRLSLTYTGELTRLIGFLFICLFDTSSPFYKTLFGLPPVKKFFQNIMRTC